MNALVVWKTASVWVTSYVRMGSDQRVWVIT